MTLHAAVDVGLPPLALTMGEPAGIGGEIALKAWLGGAHPFFVIDDKARLARLASDLGLAVPVRAVADPEEAPALYHEALPVLDRPLPVPPVAGRPDSANAPAVVAAIETAVELVRGGRAAAVVTNPIHKGALYATGFRFPGHTEFLAHLAGLVGPPVMMLASSALTPVLRVVPVTIHRSLRQAVADLDAAAIVAAAVATEAALRRDFGIARPRLAVAGLNPHAGEDGTMGNEERDLIAPAIADLGRRGLDVHGPVSPDTLFTARARLRYDAAVCMYHDQALIPIKTLDFEGTVNVTLGLPFVRTSPDHGTAFDIAGSGRASPASLMAALELAAAMAARRAAAPVG